MKIQLLFLVLVPLGCALSACEKEDTPTPPTPSTLELLRNSLLGSYTGTYSHEFVHYAIPHMSSDTTYVRTYVLEADTVDDRIRVDGGWSLRLAVDSTIYYLFAGGGEQECGRFSQDVNGLTMEYHMSMQYGHAHESSDFTGYRD